MVEVNVLKLSNSKAFRKTGFQNFSTMVKVNVLKLSNSKAFWKTGFQNFFNHGEGKGTQTKQFKAFGTKDKEVS